MTRSRPDFRSSARQPRDIPVPAAVPGVTASPGLHLRRAVGAVLADLRKVTPGDHHAVRRIRGDIRGALAHTAALGETCMLAPAVAAVRAAEHQLASGRLDSAGEALAEALRRLAPAR